MEPQRYSLDDLSGLIDLWVDAALAEILEEVKGGALPNHEQARPRDISDAESTTAQP
jgi:hypothetical protein